MEQQPPACATRLNYFLYKHVGGKLQEVKPTEAALVLSQNAEVTSEQSPQENKIDRWLDGEAVCAVNVTFTGCSWAGENDISFVQTWAYFANFEAPHIFSSTVQAPVWCGIHNYPIREQQVGWAGGVSFADAFRCFGACTGSNVNLRECQADAWPITNMQLKGIASRVASYLLPAGYPSSVAPSYGAYAGFSTAAVVVSAAGGGKKRLHGLHTQEPPPM